MASRRTPEATVTSGAAETAARTGPIHADHDATVTAPGLAGSSLESGTRIGRFVIDERLGAGGMGVVYAAVDPVLDRKVALKVLLPSNRDLDEMVLRLRREAQAAARLNHRNVVTMYDVGVASSTGEVFVAMEYVPGGTLESWASSTTRRWDEVLAIYLAAGRGLAAAHQAGIVHRDFKPSNVLIGDDGEPRVSDFGIASTGDVEPTRARDDDAPRASAGSLTRTGAVLGTPIYMAPEQRAGAKVDARADQYAFCVALHRALWKAHPFGETVAELVPRAEAHDVIEPTDRRGAPAALLPILRRGLHPDPEQRHPDLPHLLRALERVARGPARRRRIALIAAGGLLAGGAVLAWALAGGSTPAPACAGAADAIRSSWGPGQRAALAAGFTASGAPAAIAHASAERTAAHLERWSARWADARIEACRATRAPRPTAPVAELTAREQCLDRQRADLDRVVAYLTRPRAEVVARGAQIALGLPAPRACEHAAAAAPSTLAPEQLAAIADQIAAAQLRADAGVYVEAAPMARAALEQARALGARAMAAEAGLILGKVLVKQGEFEPARDTLFAAALDAQVSGQHATAVLAWSSSITALDGLDTPPAEAERVFQLGMSALELAGDAPAAEARLLADHGIYLYLRQRDAAAAIPHLERARELVRTRVDPEHPLMASVLERLGGAYFAVGRKDEGLALSRQAVALHERLLGPEHPMMGGAIHNLAVSVAATGDVAEAEPLYRRGLALKRATLGATHPSVSNSLIELGELLAVTGRFDEAVALAREDLALWQARAGERSEEASESLEAIGHVLVAAGRPAEAIEPYTQAIELMATLDADHVTRGRKNRIERARALVLAGRVDDATRELDAVVKVDPALATSPRYLRERGRVELARLRPKAALAHLRAAEAALGDQPSRHLVNELDLLLAEALHATGDAAGAADRLARLRATCVREACGIWTRGLLARADALRSRAPASSAPASTGP